MVTALPDGIRRLYIVDDRVSTYLLSVGAMRVGDLRDPRLIKLKGILFLGLGLFASLLLVMRTQDPVVGVLLVIAVWAFCRFYYFAFYVIQNYVDSEFRFTGLIHFVRYFLRNRW